jgi:protein-S-isoprenylcysteine O-methyltransferase Ste14
MTNLLALVAIIFWPVIPLFWIPVHFATTFFKRLGFFSYIIPVILWLPVAYVIYRNRLFLLQYKIELPVVLRIAGIIFLISGSLLHIWTARLLGLAGIIGVPEISTKIHGKLVTGGPFQVVRHPTYLAHTLIFSGVFLMTGVITVGILTLVDLIVVNTIIITLEEKELLIRFGDEYKLYRERVPSRFFPWFRAG